MGYFKVPNWLVDNSIGFLSPPEIVVLLFLIRHANKNGTSWYSIQKMAEITRYSRNQVKTGIARLEKNGWVTIDRKAGLSSSYTLHERFREDVTRPVSWPG